MMGGLKFKKGGSTPKYPGSGTKDDCYRKAVEIYGPKTSAYRCVPTNNSQCLTKTGWKSYNEVNIGDDILAYDMESDTLKWTPILDINVYEDAPIIEMYKHNPKFLLQSTPNHNWVVYNKVYGKSPDFSKEKEEWDLILRIKKGELNYTKAENIRPRIMRLYNLYGKLNSLSEYLNSRRSTKSKGIRLMTTEELMNSDYRSYNIICAAPLDLEYSSNFNFHVDKYGKQWAKEVLNMSREQAQIWFSSAIVYDGCHKKASASSTRCEVYGFSQKHTDHGEAFVFSSVLSGRRIKYGRKRHNGVTQYYCAGRSYYPGYTLNFRKGQNTQVWCPTTKYSTWVMKQGDFVTITGNSGYISKCRKNKAK